MKIYLGLWVVLLELTFALQTRAGSATWSASPPTNDWNTATNWMPDTVPNGATDVATLGASSITDLSVSAPVEVAAIDFQPGATAFTIKNEPGGTFTISGAGVTNNSGLLQNFSNQQDKTATSVALYFTHAATAGDSMIYTNEAPIYGGVESALIQFEDSATAGSAQFLNYAGNYTTNPVKVEFLGASNAGSANFRNTGIADQYSYPQINFRDHASAGQAVFSNEDRAEGSVNFYKSSTADHATFNNVGPFSFVFFNQNSTAGSATFNNEGGTYYNGGAITYFRDRATAGNGLFISNGTLYNGLDGYAQVGLFDEAKAEHGTFIANPGQVVGAGGGAIDVSDSATADQASFTANGSTISGAFGGRIYFHFDATANEATLVANGGVGEGEGGGILFRENTAGDTARVELRGNGFLDVQLHEAPGMTIGSLEGDGLVLLGNSNLAVGSNDLSTPSPESSRMA